MKFKLVRSPYFWAIIAVAVVVGVAWKGRADYQPILAGAQAPNFTAYDLKGDTVSLADFRGKVVMVNIWATWCGPCQQEVPAIQRLYEKFKDQPDFQIMAVSVDAPVGKFDADGEPGGDLKAFAEAHGLTYPIFHDPSGKIEELYQTTGIPETFIVGRDGVIYRKVAGGTDWDAPANQELVRRLLAG
jgi:cytochrome c biogenesis protein CcmG, thiol:disulfide interchange protein DsbE